MIFWLSLTATVYTYFLYPLLLIVLSRLVGRRDRQPSSPMDDACLPAVTMLISAYNEEKVLPEKIANCRLTINTQDQHTETKQKSETKQKFG